MKKTVALLMVALLTTWGFVTLVFAEGEEGPVTIKADSRYLAKSDVNAMAGEIQIAESSLDLSYAFKMFEQLPVTLSLGLKHTDINEDLPLELPSRMEGRSFTFSTKFPLPFNDSDQYFIGLDVSPSLYTDDWKWESSAFRVPFRTYLIYKNSESLIFVAGASVRIDYDNTVLPIIGVIYKPNDQLSFNLASDDPNISYKLNDHTTAFAEFGYVLDEYEVTRSGQKGVVLKYRETSTGLGVKYAVGNHLQASLSAGGVFGRRLEYRDSVGKADLDSTPYVRGKMQMNF